MNDTEYDRMASVEGDHWWYRGFRGLIEQLLVRFRPNIAAAPRVLDAGCGTGENLRLLRSRLVPGYLGGFDASVRAVAYSRVKAPDADVYVSDLCNPEIRVPVLDLILCADVIYMTGLLPALPGLRMLVSRLSSGGYLFLHVPAYDWLFSNHDVSVGTRQRFTRSEIRTLLDELGLVRELLTYRMSLLFPLIVLARLPSIVFGAAVGRSLANKSDLKLPSRWVNACLTRVVHLESWLIARGVCFICGSSIVAVGRKP